MFQLGQVTDISDVRNDTENGDAINKEKLVGVVHEVSQSVVDEAHHHRYERRHQVRRQGGQSRYRHLHENL